MKNIILLAVQGAGKGTLAKRLSSKYGYVHISMGDILRERSSVEDELGKKIKDLIDNGLFVPDDIIFEAISYKISQKECENGYILDGFPRSMEQAIGYDALLEKLNKDIGIVINLTIPSDLLKNRILGRRTCKKCGAIYNIYSDTLCPKEDGICDKCGGELVQREDDNETSLKKRVDTYFEVTAPLVDYYKNKGILYEIESIDSDETLAQVDAILEKLGD